MSPAPPPGYALNMFNTVVWNKQRLALGLCKIDKQFYFSHVTNVIIGLIYVM